jgi:hypothetical protein
MRIAVIFGGQLRTGVETSKSVLNFLGDYLPNCDFFVHAWDITSYKKGDYSGSHLDSFDWDSVKLKDEYLNEFLEIYKPLKYEITSFLKFREEVENSKDYMMPPWAYSFWKSNELKKQYEKENEFKYDYVIKLRGDLIFWPNFFLSPVIEYIKNNNFDKIPMYHLEDMLYLSTSEGMDLMSSIGHPTNGTLLEDFRKNFPEDLNRRIVQHIRDTFENIPKINFKDNSGYFLLRGEARNLSYDEMDEMYYIFEHYYDKPEQI